MNNIPIFSIDLYKSTIKHIENMNIKKVLNFKIKSHLICEAIYWYRAKIRRTCASALTKGQVNGTGKKPFAQKGRGIARQGSLRNPHQRGGGVAFPPNKNTYSYKINKKKKYIAIKSIIVTRLKENRIKIVEDISIRNPSTKIIAEIIKKLKFKKVLFIDRENSLLKLSLRNILGATFIQFDQLNIFKLVLFPHILITKYAFSKLLVKLFPKLLR